MNKPTTVLDYSRRIERVARHIGAHLDQRSSSAWTS
jgi:hypothetical protein